MRKTMVLILSFFQFFFSCQKEELASFQLEYSNIQFVIPAGLAPFQRTGLVIEDIPTQINSYLSARNLGINDIDRIIPRSIRLISLGQDAPFGFLQRCYASIQNTSIRQEIAYHEIIRDDEDKVLDLIPSQGELSSIMTGERFDFVIEFIPKGTNLNTSIDTEVRILFDVYLK